MEASLKVQHVDPLSLPMLCPILPHVIKLVLVLGHSFVDRNYVLAHPEGFLKQEVQG